MICRVMATSETHPRFPSPAVLASCRRDGGDVITRGRSCSPCDAWVEGCAGRLPGAQGYEWVAFPPVRQRHPEGVRSYDG